MAKKKSQIYRSRQEWQTIVDQQRDSGKSAIQYCREQQLSEKSFYAWRRRLRSNPLSKSGEFVQVHSEHQKADHVIQIHTPGGYRLEIPRGLGGDTLRTVLKALESI